MDSLARLRSSAALLSVKKDDFSKANAARQWALRDIFNQTNRRNGQTS